MIKAPMPKGLFLKEKGKEPAYLFPACRYVEKKLQRE